MYLLKFLLLSFIIVICTLLGEIMQKERKEFLEAWADTKETCGQIEALLHIIKNYCEVNDDVDRRFFYIEVLLDIILYKNY